MPMPCNEIVPLAVVSTATLIAATTDLFIFKVYNILTLPTLLGGLIASYWFGGLHGLTAGLLGAGLGFGVLVVFYALGGVGAGDVKLFAAIGAWLGPALSAQVFVASALAAGVYALGLTVLRGGTTGAAIEVGLLGQMMLRPGSWTRPLTRIETEVKRSDRRGRLVPFAAMTCLGFFATLAWSAIHLDKIDTHFGPPASVSQSGGGR